MATIGPVTPAGLRRLFVLGLLGFMPPALSAQQTGEQLCTWEGYLDSGPNRARAIRRLMESPLSEAQLRDSLRSRSDHERDRAVRLLAGARDPGTVVAILTVLDDRNEVVRDGAIRSLGTIGDSRALPRLRALVGKGSSIQQQAVAAALGQMGDPAALSVLLEASRSTEKHVRTEATWSLGLMRSRNAIPRLLELANDPQPHVRLASICSLGPLRIYGTRDETRRIERAIRQAGSDGNRDVRAAAAWRLESAGDVGSAAPDSTMAIVGGTLIDGLGGPPIADAVVVVRGSRIMAAGPATSVPVPPGARRVDVSGAFLIPGMWDMHVHLVKEGKSSLAMYVASGVTSVRDMGGPLGPLRLWQRQITEENRVGPSILTAGPMLESEESMRVMAGLRLLNDSSARLLDRVVVSDTLSARRVVDSLAALGVDLIKVRNFADSQSYWAIARAARRHGLMVAGHPPNGLDELAVADSGQRTVEHGFFPWRLDSMPVERRSAVITAFREHGVAMVPTLTPWSSRRILVDSVRMIVDGPAALRDPWRPALDSALLASWRKEIVRFSSGNKDRPYTPEQLREWNAVLDGMAKDHKLMYDAGVMVLPGSDMAVGFYPGRGVRAELAAFVASRIMSPGQAIQSATRQPAIFLGLQDSLGTIEAGKVANLVVLARDPLADIRNLESVSGVILRGRFLDRHQLDAAVLATEP